MSLSLRILLLVIMLSVMTMAFRTNTIRRTIRSLSMVKVDLSSPARVRFAPSPTGTLHVGGARTALYNWLIAKKTGGKFIIRVEDTDEARSTRESETSILNDIKWMNMGWDEGPELEDSGGGPFGPYRQSERKSIYKTVADKLIADGVAYPCFCSAEELDKKREEAEAKGEDPKYDGTWRDADPVEVKAKIDAGDEYTVRFKVPSGKVVSIDDAVRGTVTWNAEECLGDFIILRSSGMPVYNFCVAVDDANMQITHVVRAEEHLSNTLRQMLILEALEFTPPKYAHCSLILGSDRSKLSKRHGATSVTQFKEQGFLPVAMMNYLANLGWNDGTDKEIYTQEELINAFDLERVVKNPAMFDIDKLKWINSQHLKALPDDEIHSLVCADLGSEGGLLQGSTSSTADGDSNGSGGAVSEFIAQGVSLAKKDMELVGDAQLVIRTALLYNLAENMQGSSDAQAIMSQEGWPLIVNKMVTDYSNNLFPDVALESFSADFKAYVKSMGKEFSLKGKALFLPVRLALTGRVSGPDIGEQLRLVGLARGAGVTAEVVDLASRMTALAALDVKV